MFLIICCLGVAAPSGGVRDHLPTGDPRQPAHPPRGHAQGHTDLIPDHVKCVDNPPQI